MATFIAVSGPSTTGKTALIDSLVRLPEFRDIVFSPDINDVVWEELVSMKLFTEFTEISTDSDYLCTYIFRVIDRYNEFIDMWKKENGIVILDKCWVDYAIYAILQMWYTRIIKSVQEEILHRIALYDEQISRIYITQADDKKYPVDKYRMRGKMSTFRENRPLELRYYDLAKHLKNAIALPSSDISESSQFIINDLKDLGYL